MEVLLLLVASMVQTPLHCVAGSATGVAGAAADTGQPPQGWAAALLLLLLLLVVVLAAVGALARRVCWLQWLTCCAASWLQYHLHMVSGGYMWM